MAIFEEKEILEATTTAASFNGELFMLKNMGFSVHFSWKKTAGTLAGTMKLQGKGSVNLPWVDISGATATLTDTTTETAALINIQEQHYNYCRLVVTITGGTGTFRAYLSSKDN